MKIICNKQNMSDALTNVSKAAADKSTIPALEGVKMKLNKDKLSLTGYDLEIGITTTVPVVSEDVGEAVIKDVKSFTSMIKSMPTDEIEIEFDDNLGIHISGGTTNYSITALSADEYPAIPDMNIGEEIVMSQSVLKSLINETVFAVATNDTKPIFKGELFEIEDNKLNVVALDSFRLAVRSETIKCSESYKFVVPSKTLTEVSKLLKDEDDLTVSIRVTKKQVVFSFSDYTVFSRLLEGEFHNYRGSIPKTSVTEVIIDRRELIDCLERASLMVSERVKSPVRCTFDGGAVKIICSTPMGKFEDENPAEVTGPKIEIGFNCRYFLDPLKVISDDKIKLMMNGGNLPMKIVPCDGEEYTYLVLPVRLK